VICIHSTKRPAATAPSATAADGAVALVLRESPDFLARPQQQHHQLQQLMVLMLRYCEKVINSSSFLGYDDPQNHHISTLAWMKLKRVALTTEISCAPHAFAFRSLTPPRVCAFPSLSPLLPPPSSRNHRCASMPSSWCPFREPPCWQMSRQTRFPMHMSRDGSTPPSQATLGENLRVCVSLC